MNLANDSEFEAPDSGSIWLELSFEGQTHSFSLQSDETRAVAVGSLLGADLRIDRAGVAPVQFHIEREDGQLWIVPAYGSNELRVDAVRVRGPKRIDRRALIEFCGLRVNANVLDVQPRPERSSCVRPRQTSSEALRDRGKAFEERLLGAVESGPPIQTLNDAELPTTAFQRYVVPAIVGDEQATTRYPVFSKDVEIPSRCTAAIEPLRATGLGEVIRPAPIRVVGALSDFRQQGEGPPSAQTQETLRFVPMQSKPLLTAVPHEVIGDTSEFDVSGANSGEPRFIPWLSRLGLLTKSRPMLVFLGGITTAFVLSAIISWFTSHEKHSIRPVSRAQFDMSRTNLRNSPR